MRHPLIRKLEHFTRLPADSKCALETALGGRIRHVDARVDITREGERPDNVVVILSGWACRYKQLEDGRRQIVAYALPGDICDLNAFVLRRTTHPVGAVTAVSYADLSRDRVEALTSRHPQLMEALWWETLVCASIQREWAVNLGQRDAVERLGHLLCEIFLRLRAVGLTDGDSCMFPVTQADLAETTGLSAVHVNRTLQDIRGSGLIVLRGKTLTIPNLRALMQASFFDPSYLHMDQMGSDLDLMTP